jgi:hypothetical protein
MMPHLRSLSYNVLRESRRAALLLDIMCAAWSENLAYTTTSVVIAVVIRRAAKHVYPVVMVSQQSHRSRPTDYRQD